MGGLISNHDLHNYNIGWDMPVGHSGTLKGWGIGLTYTRPDDWFARVDYARRIGDDGHAQGDAMSRDRFWFLVGKTF